MNEFDKLVQVDNVLDQERKNRQALLILLDAQNDKKDHLLSLECRMGSTRSYITSATLGWIAERVRLATELPLFKQHRNPETNKVELNLETAALIQQREPDWRRQFPMTLYLAKRKRHKFPPLLLVVTQSWVDDDSANEWGPNGVALRDSVNAQALDSHGRVVDLVITPQDLLYAIDGQHRLMAMKGLAALLSNGTLSARDQSGKETSRAVTIDEIVEASNGEVTHSQLQQLTSEAVGIEVIPAVLKGETRKQALRRIRSIFVHVNKTAAPLTSGELALLDEDDGYAITARVLMVAHELLKKKDRVQLKKGQLLPSAEAFTTLETLRGVVESFLSQFDEFRTWKPDSRTEMFMRPEEESLDNGYAKMAEYFSAIAKLPSHARLMQGGEARSFREDEGHLLFRPIGQLALAEAIGSLVSDQGLRVEKIVDRLRHGEHQGLLDIRSKKGPWYGVVYDGKVMKKNDGAKRLAARLLIHVLGGGTADEAAYADLKRDFAEARITDQASQKATDLSGNQVDPAQVELPAPW
jgi:hypothetical protein